MTGADDPMLVLVSIAVALFAWYTLLALAARLRTIPERDGRCRWWRIGGALATGNGLWSMQYLGTFAPALPVHLVLNPWMVGLSLAVWVAAAYLALRLMAATGLGPRRRAVGGVALGLGIAGGQSLWMSAILVAPAVRYSPVPLVTSFASAMALAAASLWVAFRLRRSDPDTVWVYRGVASLALSLGLGGVHWQALSAAVFMPHAMSIGQPGISPEMSVTVVAVAGFGGLMLLWIVSLMDERYQRLMRRATERLEEAARIRQESLELDALFGCMSRAALIERLEHKMVEAERVDQHLGIIFLDLDSFKTVNDSLGFAAGDELLRSFFEHLRRLVRSGTMVARLSGDEFLVVLEGFEDETEIASVARSIYERLERNFHIQGLPLRVTASAGVALYDRDGGSAAALLKSANLALHAAKRDGKNSLRFFEPQLGETAGKMLQINHSLGEALEQKQFSLMFQPKFDTHAQRISGAEALIRWKHPLLGNIPPMEFIPAAEETGQILQISEWVIVEVCRQINEWKARGLPPMRISINLSPEQLREDDYAQRVADLVVEAGVDPRSILFEITETAAMREPKRAGEVIREFQRAGFDFAIDDFGTGYSSLAYLQQFRVRELKIDKCFINAIQAGGAESTTIVSAIIGLAHALGMTVVAEGVETAEQLQQLNAMYCDEVQGYLLGRPLTPADFEERVQAEGRGAVKAVAVPVLRSAMA